MPDRESALPRRQRQHAGHRSFDRAHPPAQHPAGGHPQGLRRGDRARYGKKARGPLRQCRRLGAGRPRSAQRPRSRPRCRHPAPQPGSHPARPAHSRRAADHAGHRDGTFGISGPRRAGTATYRPAAAVLPRRGRFGALVGTCGGPRTAGPRLGLGAARARSSPAASGPTLVGPDERPDAGRPADPHPGVLPRRRLGRYATGHTTAAATPPAHRAGIRGSSRRRHETATRGRSWQPSLSCWSSWSEQ